MAYYIFLISLRSLEEFRKNPHVKIPPKSPSTNFQSLGKFKNPIFNSEIHFSLLSARPTVRPTRPLAQPAPLTPLLSWAETTLASPPSPCVGRVFTEYIFPFGSCLPSLPPLPRLSVKQAPAVSTVPHLRLPNLARVATAFWPPRAAQLCASGAAEPLPPRLMRTSLLWIQTTILH
jgi:hypothetical protein